MATTATNFCQLLIEKRKRCLFSNRICTHGFLCQYYDTKKGSVNYFVENILMKKCCAKVGYSVDRWNAPWKMIIHEIFVKGCHFPQLWTLTIHRFVLNKIHNHVLIAPWFWFQSSLFSLYTNMIVYLMTTQQQPGE